MLYDITPAVTPGLAVWPGDTPAERTVLMDLARGDSVTLSTLRATVHLGAHVDAPSHYRLGAPDIASRPLEIYWGPCQVLRADVRLGARVTSAMLRSEITAPRVLIATGTFPDPATWNSDFAGLEPELVDSLADRGVRLVGIDTPSVDLSDSKDLPAHARCLAREVAILEGIVLDRVPDGRYELVALPLRLVGFDASPVRAVLRALR